MYFLFLGERPFKCIECDRAFNQKGALRIHMSKHTGLKPHPCDFCPMSFAQRGNLRAHIQVKWNTVLIAFLFYTHIMNLLLKVWMLKKYILLHFIFDWHIVNFYENTKFDFQLAWKKYLQVWIMKMKVIHLI